MILNVPDSNSTRRRFLKTAAAATAGTFLSAMRSFPSNIARAQDPPACPTAPSGGKPFAAGSDTRPIVLRKPISAFAPSELSELQTAFANLRALPPGDNRRWLLEADVHALFCDQCSGVNMQIHGSWNFFPWHRAYLYYYERILGSLVGDLDNFRLPYWDWENSRSMPSPYRNPGNTGNPLWDSRRDSGIAGGGNLPASDGTTSRIHTLYGITDFASFGGTAAFAGACENDPHNIIHSDVGPAASPFEDMGNLGYAARDPIFFAHHCNIDKLWSGWNGQPGGTGTDFKNPTDSGFLTARWSFYDENQKVVSISAADVLDHRNNLRYVYTLPRIPIPIYYEIYICELICCLPGPDPLSFLKVSQEVRETLLTQFRESTPMVLVLHGVEIPEGVTGVFDVAAVRGDRRLQIGSLSVLADTIADKRHKPITLVLDITRAAEDLLAPEKPAGIRLFARHEKENKSKPFTLRAQSAQIRTERRGAKPQA